MFNTAARRRAARRGRRAVKKDLRGRALLTYSRKRERSNQPLATQLTEQQFARRLAYVASLSLPDSIVKEAINRLADVNGFAKSKDAAAALNGRTPARRGAAVLTGVKDAVLRALSAIQGEFTYHEVERELERMKYDFQALNRVSSIGRVLRGLRKQGTLTLVRKGKAGETNVFRKATP